MTCITKSSPSLSYQLIQLPFLPRAERPAAAARRAMPALPAGGALQTPAYKNHFAFAAASNEATLPRHRAPARSQPCPAPA